MAKRGNIIELKSLANQYIQKRQRKDLLQKER
jgi:hypothetical protein